MKFAISDDEESVASNGFKRDGLDDVDSCSVDANRVREKSKKTNIFTLIYLSIIYI